MRVAATTSIATAMAEMLVKTSERVWLAICIAGFPAVDSPPRQNGQER